MKGDRTLHGTMYSLTSSCVLTYPTTCKNWMGEFRLQYMSWCVADSEHRGRSGWCKLFLTMNERTTDIYATMTRAGKPVFFAVFFFSLNQLHMSLKWFLPEEKMKWKHLTRDQKAMTNIKTFLATYATNNANPNTTSTVA